MRRGRVLVLALGFGLAAALGAGASAAATSPAHAAAAPTTGPDAISLNGPGVTGTLTVTAADQRDLFRDLLSEVDWLATRPANAPNPDPARLGPKYQVVVLVSGAAQQMYDVYPLATGGPRVFRPAEQPGRKVAAGWFYGRVSMPDTLHAAGVPIVVQNGAGPGPAPGQAVGTAPADPSLAPSGTPGAGGQGGGEPAQPVGVITSVPKHTGLADVLGEMKRGLLLILGGAAFFLILLALLAHMISRRT